MQEIYIHIYTYIHIHIYIFFKLTYFSIFESIRRTVSVCERVCVPRIFFLGHTRRKGIHISCYRICRDGEKAVENARASWRDFSSFFSKFLVNVGSVYRTYRGAERSQRIRATMRNQSDGTSEGKCRNEKAKIMDDSLWQMFLLIFIERRRWRNVWPGLFERCVRRRLQLHVTVISHKSLI